MVGRGVNFLDIFFRHVEYVLSIGWNVRLLYERGL